MAVVYSIRDWDKHFENAELKSYKHLNWVRMPVKHDGKSFRRLMLREDAGEMFAAWVLIVQVAAKQPTRGVLADTDGPLDASDLAIKTGFCREVFDTALKVLASKEIGWLLAVDCQRDASAMRIENEENEEKKDCDEPAKPTSSPPSDPSQVAFPEFPCVPGRKSGPRTWLLTEAHAAELASTFPALDVPAEARKAHGWVKANLTKRKTHDGMSGFLYRWMAREQNRGGHRSGNGRLSVDPPPVSTTTPPPSKIRKANFASGGLE